MPQHITGAWLCDCVDEYHQINLRQITAAQMLMEMAAPSTQMMPMLPEASQFSVSKAVRFDPEVGQPGVFAYKQQFWPRLPISSKGKEPQSLARIVKVQTDESNSKAGPSKFTHEFPLHEPKPIEPDAQLMAKHSYAKAPDLASPMGNASTAVFQPPLRNDCAYTTTTNIYNPRVAQKVFD